MHKRRRKRKLSYEDKIAQMFLEKTDHTFSLHIENINGFKLVSEMITDYLLKDYPERERLLMFSEELPKVKNALHNAIRKLEEQGHCVMRGPKDGRLQWITLTPNYRKAREQDSERTEKQTRSKVNLAIKHINLSNPKRLPEFKQSLITTVSDSKKMLTGKIKSEK